jgi:hypothetical protein
MTLSAFAGIRVLAIPDTKQVDHADQQRYRLNPALRSLFSSHSIIDKHMEIKLATVRAYSDRNVRETSQNVPSIAMISQSIKSRIFRKETRFEQIFNPDGF